MDLEKTRKAMEGKILRFSGESVYKISDKKTDATWESPRATKFKCWLEGLSLRRYRVEFNPLVLPWENGSQPFHQEDRTQTSDGRTLFCTIFNLDPATQARRPGRVIIDDFDGSKGKLDRTSIGMPFFPFSFKLNDGRGLFEALAESDPVVNQKWRIHDLYSITLNQKIKVIVDAQSEAIESIEAIASNLEGQTVLHERWGFDRYADLGNGLKFPRQITYRHESAAHSIERSFAYDDAGIEDEGGDGLFAAVLPPGFKVFDNRSNIQSEAGQPPSQG